MKNLAGNAFDDGMGARRAFRDLLWRAFPERSEDAICHRASRALGRSPRTVKNWLRCENDAGVSDVMAVMAIAGAEIVFRRMEGRR